MFLRKLDDYDDQCFVSFNRDEFRMFSVEVGRFGDMCKDPQWHNLGRYFEK